MENIPFEMRAGQLNQTYEKIKNCRVVKPPYDPAGFYSAEFFLDKRFGLESVYHSEGKTFWDYIDIKGIRYYLYTMVSSGVTRAYIGTLVDGVMVNVHDTGFIMSENSPRKIIYGKNVYGPYSHTGFVTDPRSGTGRGFNVDGMDDYTGGYVKFKPSNRRIIDIGDYILFTGDTSVLRGGVNKIQDVDFAIIKAKTIGSKIILVDKSKIPFIKPLIESREPILIRPAIGSSTLWQTAFVDTVNPDDGTITLNIEVSCEIGDQLVYGDYVYIIGTNARGSIPKPGDTFDIFPKETTSESYSILIGHTDETGKGIVSMLVLNGTEDARIIQVLNTSEEIVDMTIFDANIFVLTNSKMYFSRSTFDDNTQFYPLDNYPIDVGTKMFPMGRSLLVFGRTNKLFAAATTTNNKAIGYVGYDVNYSGKYFSKDSMIFADQTIYIMQDDKQLMQVNIVSNNSTSFDIVLKNIMINTRGVFEDVQKGGTITVCNSQGFLNFLYVKDGNTINYVFDKQYQHWTFDEYPGIVINKISDEIMAKDHIIRVGEGYTDLGNEYEQEVNFSLNGGMRMNMPYIIKTIFGLIPSKLDVKLDISFDLGGKKSIMHKDYKNFAFDSRLSDVLTADDLVGYEELPDEVIEYNGATVSIQSSILKTGRYIAFKYNSLQRFCIGDSYVFTDYTKPFVNESNSGI